MSWIENQELKFLCPQPLAIFEKFVNNSQNLKIHIQLERFWVVRPCIVLLEISFIWLNHLSTSGGGAVSVWQCAAVPVTCRKKRNKPQLYTWFFKLLLFWAFRYLFLNFEHFYLTTQRLATQPLMFLYFLVLLPPENVLFGVCFQTSSNLLQ